MKLYKIQHTKFLGVLVDKHLNCKVKINSVSMKLSKASGILLRVRSQLTEKALLNVYFTLCYPHMICCVGCTWPSFLQDIIVVQKRIKRIICYKGKYDHAEDIFKDSHLLDYLSVHEYFFLLGIFKSLYNSSISEFSSTVQAHGTRNTLNNLVCLLARTTVP